jgi:putative polyketide hydroxylase
VISPTAPAAVPQDHLEPVLLAHLQSLAAGRVALGTEVAGVEDRPDRVRVVLRDVADDAIRVVDARYLIAADGAYSTVRGALGIQMRGPDRLLEAVSALFRAPLWGLVGDHRYGVYEVTHPQAQGVFLPAGRADRWLYGVMYEPRNPVADITEEGMSQRIELGAGVAGLKPRIERIGGFSFAAQVAKRFRTGNAFLVGDAAHRATPRGGTGMNTGIHDGYDLGWKLAWVLRGWADPELLDSHERERRPVAEHNVKRSADPLGAVREASQELQADLGGRITHAWIAAAGDRVSTLDVLGPGLTLFTGPERTPWEAAAAALRGRLPVTVRSLEAITARRSASLRAAHCLSGRTARRPAGSRPGKTPCPRCEQRSPIRSPLPTAARRRKPQRCPTSERRCASPRQRPTGGARCHTPKSPCARPPSEGRKPYPGVADTP